MKDFDGKMVNEEMVGGVFRWECQKADVKNKRFVAFD